ncbi:MAG: hypothetical protein K8I27_05330 [Planctomycetes bacterium]|nr:hypothetical protein [Planctomycetota bacterium]
MRKLSLLFLAVLFSACSGGEVPVPPPSNTPVLSNAAGSANKPGETPAAEDKKPVPAKSSDDPTTAAQRRSELDMIAEDYAFVGRLASGGRRIPMDRFPYVRALLEGQFYATLGAGEYSRSKFSMVYVPVWNKDDPAYRFTLKNDFSYTLEEVEVPQEFSVKHVLASFGDDVRYDVMAALGDVRDTLRVAYAKNGAPQEFDQVPELKELSLPAPYAMPSSYTYTVETGTLKLEAAGESAEISLTFEWQSGDSKFVVGGREFSLNFQQLKFMKLYEDRQTSREAYNKISRKTIEDQAKSVLEFRDGDGKWLGSAAGLRGRQQNRFVELCTTSKHRISAGFQDEESGEAQLLIREFGTDAVCVVKFNPGDESSTPQFNWSQ